MTQLIKDKGQKAPTRPNRYLVMFFFLLLFWGYWIIAWLLERIDYNLVIPGIWGQIITNFPLFAPIRPIFEFIAEIFSWRVVRHLVPLFAGWLLAYIAAYRFLESFYGLADGNMARAVFGRLRGSLLATGAKLKIQRETLEKERKKDPLFLVGGPGRIVVGHGDAVVTELNGRFKRILGPGSHTLERFEYPVAFVDVRPQEREKEDVHVVTSDGINVKTSVGVSFQIDPGDAVPSQKEPFPFNETSVRQAAYGQTNQGEGKVDTWESLPLIIAMGQLGEVVSQTRLDELVDPDDADLRMHEKLKKTMETRARSTMRRFGVLVRMARLGRLELPDEVRDQRLEYWGSYWEREEDLRRKAGEAVARDIEEMANAQAEALMLQALAEGLQRAKSTDLDFEPKAIVALRLVEALEKMAQQTQTIAPLPDGLQSTLLSLHRQLQPENDATNH